MNVSPKSVCLIGAGRVASHLAVALSHHFVISCIYSRHIHNARHLAQRIDSGIAAVDDLSALPTDASIYIICVSDDAIAHVVRHTAYIRSGLWVHTSGSTGIEVFDGIRDHCGVLYPLMTFTIGADIDFHKVPLLVEGIDDDSLADILTLAHSLSDNVVTADSALRARIHLAAVMACNFSNYMYSLAYDILHQSGVDFSILLPLIDATVAKVHKITPHLAQTGPAQRGDISIVNSQASRLQGDAADLYTHISTLIYNRYNEQNKL